MAEKETAEVSMSRKEYDALQAQAGAAPAPTGKKYDDRGFKTIEGMEDIDTNGDGHISQGEMDMHLEFKRKELEDADAMRDAQRKMAWFSLFGMLLYPFAVVSASLAGLSEAQATLGDMAPTYFVAVAGIVAAFFGAQAFSKGK
jgi:hypothetical protein|tara:strand:- start:608 stop:1039 length:432 start_codon:yes stop_codon:yes gene_type:complete